MSNLKHQCERQLVVSKFECERYISNLKRLLGGQETRLVWINKYMKDKEEEKK